MSINIRADTNNAKTSLGDKNIFSDLNRLITDMNNNKVKKESAIKRMEKIV